MNTPTDNTVDKAQEAMLAAQFQDRQRQLAQAQAANKQRTNGDRSASCTIKAN